MPGNDGDAVRWKRSPSEQMEQAMSIYVASTQPQPRSVLSNASTTLVAVITAMTFSASGAAPTPLYHQYQESFGLTPFAITVVFAAYVLSLLTALLTVGSLSDYI